jgi:hypothetical protein
MAADEWIGVDEVAAEMRYTQRQAWEYIRSIGLASANTRNMNLARFTRAEFNEARERAKAPIPLGRGWLRRPEPLTPWL